MMIRCFRRCRSATTGWAAMFPVFSFPLILSLSAGPTRGADVDLRAALEQANQAMADQDYPAAVKAYQKAIEADPDQPGLAYNLGVAAYKQGQLEEAKDRFTQALQNATPNVEARAKFNLGNVAYAQALKKVQAAPEAIQLLRSAVAHYRDALEVRPDDVDARANIESAWLLLDKLRQQQEKQKKQSKDQSKKNSKDQEKKNDSQQEKNKDKNGDQKRDDQKKSAPQSQPSENRDQQQKDQQKTESSASDPDKSESREGTPQPVQAKPMTREEAERLLQSVRDRERARRLQVAERIREKPVTVKRDW